MISDHEPNPNNGRQPIEQDDRASFSAGSPPPAGAEGKPGRKELTEEQKTMFPDGDTRWPLPNEVRDKSLHMLYNEKGRRRAVYYALKYRNKSTNVPAWSDTIGEHTIAGLSNIPNGEAP